MKTLLPIALWALAAVAHAQTVWRCGTDGRSYADNPCPGGRELAVGDARTLEQRTQHADMLAREAAMTRALVAQRREREAQWRQDGPGLIAIKPTAAQPPDPAPKAKPSPKSKSKRRPEARGTWPSTARPSHGTRG